MKRAQPAPKRAPLQILVAVVLILLYNISFLILSFQLFYPDLYRADSILDVMIAVTRVFAIFNLLLTPFLWAGKLWADSIIQFLTSLTILAAAGNLNRAFLIAISGMVVNSVILYLLNTKEAKAHFRKP